MRYYEVKNNEIKAISALKRKLSAPQLVVVAPSGSGKSTMVYLLLNHRLIPYMKIGIGDKSQTTIIPCEFCFDVRIPDEDSFAIQITKKDFSSKDIHITILTVLMDLFGKNDCDPEETLEAFDPDVFEQILEPEEAMYHLGKLRDDISLDELKGTLMPILEEMVDNDFRARVKQRKEELKSKKVKLSEVREIIFEEMFEEMSEGIKEAYVSWLNGIGQLVRDRLKNAVGDKLFNGNMIEYSLSEEDKGTQILSALFDPSAPYSLIIDHISLASRPREELIKIANEKSPNIPFRFCIRDTMGLTQKGIDANSAKDSLEVALNCKADTILFLMSLEDRDDALAECCRALVEKKDDLKKKSHLDTSVYVLFTKADRLVENRINKRNEGELYINADTYKNNIQEVLASVEETVNEYAGMIPKEEVGWLSLRYVQDSLLLNSLEDDPRKKNFQPDGLFDIIVDFSLKTLKRTLPEGMEDPIFITPKKPDEPAIQVLVDEEKIKEKLDAIQKRLSEDLDIVNGYIISDRTPRLHGKSVAIYWDKLTRGLGHSTRASVYGNFSINMKGLLKNLLYLQFASLQSFGLNCAVKCTADNLSDKALKEVMKNLFGKDDIETGLNPAIGDRNICLQRLYEFCRVYFEDSSRYAILIDRVAYDLSYGNEELKRKLTYTYNYTPGYDGAMRKLQSTFRDFFGSEDFRRILIEEFNATMTEMVNKMFIAI